MGGLYARRTERVPLPPDRSNRSESAWRIYGRVGEGVIDVKCQLNSGAALERTLRRFDADDPWLLHVLV